MERYLTANNHVFNLQRRTYSSSMMYCFSSFSGCTKDIILRKRISLKQPETPGRSFDVLSNRKKKNKNLLLEKYM